jgi:hypothetical protein
MDEADELTLLVDLEQIKSLKARYCHLMDRQRWSEWAELYTADAELFPGEGRRLVGGNEIAEFARETLAGVKTSHHATTPDIEFIGPSTARATWAVQFVQEGGRLRGYGFYEDQLEKLDGRWLFRTVELVTSWMEGSAAAQYQNKGDKSAELD